MHYYLMGCLQILKNILFWLNISSLVFYLVAWVDVGYKNVKIALEPNFIL